MYQSPIEIITKQMRTQFEDNVFKAIQDYGIVVDKEELIKALQYDRNQYEKGFADGMLARKDEWISVEERLPENDWGKHWKDRKYYLVFTKPSGLMNVAVYGYKEHDWWVDRNSCVLSKSNYKEVTHWMPLPEAPKGGAE